MKRIVKGEKHFTASVWILSKATPSKILLVHHKKLDKWIQPGGHIEKFENPVECAIREIREETGVDIGFLQEQIKTVTGGENFLPIPRFLMEYSIPPYENQPQHFHIDINYVVGVEEQELNFNKSEIHSIGWFSMEEALKLQIHENTRIILKKLLV